MGVITGTSPIAGSISEYLRAGVILLYFPIREEITSYKKLNYFVKHLIFSLFLTFIFWSILNYLRISSARNIYEATSFQRSNQEIFTLGIIFGSIFYISLKGFKSKSAFLILTLFSGIGLIITFSRVYWITTIMGLTISFFFFEAKKKINILFLVFTILTIFIIGILTLAPELSEYLFDYFYKRFTSSTDLTGDVSFLSRFDEIFKLYDEIYLYLLGGMGLSRDFSYYNSSFDLVNWISPFIHNAYVHISYKAGIPMALVYFSVLGFYVTSSLSKIRKNNSEIINAFYLSSGICIIIFLIVSLLTSTFSSRPGGVFLALVIAFINIADNLKNDK
ncbi:hypothetical protein OAQ99_03245 [Candidatus Kapabacteria bacterium]|nr:hypothetical protein [Candidatus Kapabacteria bacterium]